MPIVGVGVVGGEVHAVRAHRVVGGADLDGLGLIGRTDASGGWPRKFIARTLGVPNSTTAATWSAMSGASGLGTVAGSTPSGTAAEVTKPITAAPWENRRAPSWSSGSWPAMDMTCAPASRDAVQAGVPFIAGGVVDRVTSTDFRARARAVVDEGLPGRPDAWGLAGTAGEHHLSHRDTARPMPAEEGRQGGTSTTPKAATPRDRRIE